MLSIFRGHLIFSGILNNIPLLKAFLRSMEAMYDRYIHISISFVDVMVETTLSVPQHTTDKE